MAPARTSRLVNRVVALLRSYFALRFFRPRSEQPPDQNQLAKVIGVMVGHKQGLAENRLSLAVRERKKQVGGWIGYQVVQGPCVGAEGFDTFVPGAAVGRSVARRPIAFGEVRRN